MSSSNLTLYTYIRCFHSKLIQILSKFTDTKLNVVYLDNLSEINVKKINSKSPTGTFPVLQSGDFFLSGTLSISKYLLSNYDNLKNILLGSDGKRRALNDTWVDFTTNSIWPFYDEIIGQITGKLEAHDGLFTTAIGDFLQILSRINSHLTFRTFLVDHHISFADLVLTVALYPYFTLVLDEKQRSTVPNVERWFLYVSNLKEVSTVLGKARLCYITQKPAVATLSKVAAPFQSKSQPQIVAAPVQSKSQLKKEVKTVEVKKAESKPQIIEPQTTIEEVSKETKKQNLLDKLPPTPIDLDSFKKEFLNTTQKKEVLEKLWKNFDINGWSLWSLYYNKSTDQGKIKFKTCNLKSNFLQVIKYFYLIKKLEKFRKFTFSVHGVYGTEPNFEVQGIWMWRGTEIPEEMKEHDSYDYITFKRLDYEKDRNLIEEFWLNL